MTYDLLVIGCTTVEFRIVRSCAYFLTLDDGSICQLIPSIAKLYIRDSIMIFSCKMVDKESASGNVKTTEVNTPYETVRDSFMRAIDEVAKAQPQYSQSISNLQLDYIQTVKNLIHTTFAVQKQYVGETWNTFPSSESYRIKWQDRHLTSQTTQ